MHAGGFDVKNTGILWVLLCMLFASSCKHAENRAESDSRGKIEFDLTQLDETGLIGPEGGKVSLAYEFCIPDTEAHKAEVKAIDPGIQFYPGSRGRIGAAKHQCLCIGETHRKDYEKVLYALAELPYVERIIRCWFE